MQTKEEAPEQMTNVVFDKKRVSITLKRVDLSKMAAHSEITLPPHSQRSNDNNNGLDSVTSEPLDANEASEIEVLETSSFSQVPAQQVTLLFSIFSFFDFPVHFPLGKCGNCQFYAQGHCSPAFRFNICQNSFGPKSHQRVRP